MSVSSSRPHILTSCRIRELVFILNNHQYTHSITLSLLSLVHSVKNKLGYAVVVSFVVAVHIRGEAAKLPHQLFWGDEW